MPMYEYYCPKCSVEEIRVCTVDERNSQICKCGTKLERTISRPPAIKIKTVGLGQRT